MNYLEQLRKRAKDVGNIVCVGLDPQLDKIPVHGRSVDDTIVKFYRDILAAMRTNGVLPAAVKPNAGFYEKYGLRGLTALKTVIDDYKRAGIPVILDGKRADIADTSTAYADGWFMEWNIDAMTVPPYMGSDSVMPFITYCGEGRGVYVIVRSSNKGARDFQDLVVEGGKPVYWHVAKRLCDWYQPGLGAVVGATAPDELEELSRFFVASGKEVPFLIPGVGKQGGSAREVADILRRTGNDLALHRINASSSINYAYQDEKTTDYAGAAVRALKKLIDEIGPL